ncbi:MAG: cupredoxin domain-containing protein [Actinomycetota bacterium]
MPRTTPKLVLSLALALGLFAAACSAPPAPNLDLASSGQQFIPQVVDYLDNVGFDPAIALDSSDNPAVTYFGVAQKLKPGEIPPAHPIGSPTLPAVLLATLDTGVWTRGKVEDDVKDLTAEDATGTGIAYDSSDNLHVVWSTTKGLWYADNTAGDFSPKQVDKGPIAGPSIALDSSGTPWVAYYSGKNAYVATQKGSRWDITRIGKSGTCTDCPPPRTAVAVGSDDTPVVAFTDLSSNSPMAAVSSGKGWSTVDLESGAGGFGISAASKDDGTTHVVYYTTSGEIHDATVPANGNGSVGTPVKVGTYTASGGGLALGTSISISQDGTQHVAWSDPGIGIALASGKQGAFKPIPTQGTVGGGTPAIAVTPDGKTTYVAWYDTETQDLRVGIYAETSGELAVAEPSPTPATPGEASPSASASTCSPGPKSLDVTAKGIAFLETCLAAAADKPFTITFDNQDAGVPHNVAIKDAPPTDVTAKPLFEPKGGATVTGPATEKYQVGALKAGTYTFFCEVHPTSMFGTFVVAKG